MIEQFLKILQEAGFDLGGRELAEILWLALHIEDEEKPQETTPVFQQLTANNQPPSASIPETSHSPASESAELLAQVYLPSSLSNTSITTNTLEALPIKIPGAVALRNSLALGRALRPLMRKVPSSTEKILDEAATIYRITEEKIWVPVLKPAPQRCLDVALVVEQSSSTALWQQTISEFQRLLEHHGAFRDVRTWGLKVTEESRQKQGKPPKIKIQLFAQNSTGDYHTTPHHPQELIDANGRRLVLLVSDCISPAWRRKFIHPVLDLWGRHGLVTILQLLPERLWKHTALASESPVQLQSFHPAVFNSQFIVRTWDENKNSDIDTGDFQPEFPGESKNSISVPVITLEAEHLLTWARVIAGQGNVATIGFQFSCAVGEVDARKTQHQQQTQKTLNAPELVSRFRATASPLARRLAGLMAAAPVSLPVVQLIQKNLLPESQQIHVAEVFMSGLLKPQLASLIGQKSIGFSFVEYEFVEGVRELLLHSVPVSKTISVIDKISEFIAKRVGLSVREFDAYLLKPTLQSQDTETQIRPFAELKAQVLRQLGGRYNYLAEQLEATNRKVELIKSLYPKPGVVTNSQQTFSKINTQFFEFDVVTVNSKGEEIKREKKQSALCFTEYLTEELKDGLLLEMVTISGGKFMMGSLKGEGNPDEHPQHEVTIEPFFMGKYLVTQAQWRTVATLPRVKRDLKLNPSSFQGDDRPIDRVSWYDAVEFCARLARKTGRDYRLPNEAEWEYACRARTTTTFHFGETMTDKLANYDATLTFAEEPPGDYRQETTEVGTFLPNAFGLYDMHGNLWEWCADIWHEDYTNAPTDGSAWVKSVKKDNKSESDEPYRLLRGGSWFSNPEDCRSAFRYRVIPDHDYDIGFRVVCSAGANAH